ncbi:uncharacterized protein C12orf73 homolog [Cimex lectularius]|uniref:Uncharacterized protein n=1 Tax=Cimex lectularius TaxID=79782 RepID=A0A8I6RMA0_CIMLE|nr:uncharacterized protein C12orf73 homolog [Cimex lectularius]
MPAGVSWSKYLSALCASFLSMFAGAQVVHYYYRPLDDFEEYVQAELEWRKNLNVSKDKND